jgi:Trypsin-co-occurring domain 1
MERLVRFPLESGGGVIIQVDERQSGPVPAASPGEIAAKAKMTFEQALSQLRPIAKALLEEVKDLGPQKVEIELGIAFSAEAGVVLAKTSAEGSCKVTLSWQKSP